MVGIVDPYALLVFEGSAARGSVVMNDRNPCWGAEAARAFRFPVSCPYSTCDISINDEDEGPFPDDSVGRVSIDLSQLQGRTVYDAWYYLQVRVPPPSLQRTRNDHPASTDDRRTTPTGPPSDRH